MLTEDNKFLNSQGLDSLESVFEPSRFFSSSLATKLKLCNMFYDNEDCYNGDISLTF